MYYQQQQKQQQHQQQYLSTHRPERPKTLRTTAAVRKSTSLENHQKISVTLSTYVPPPMVPSSQSTNVKHQKNHNYHQSHSSDDESNNSSSSGTTTTRKIDNNCSNTIQTTNSTAISTILSPFDEQEEWAKISEIMATFGTDFVKDNERSDLLLKNNRLRIRSSTSNTMKSPINSINHKELSTDEQQQQQHTPQTLFADWLYENELEHLETILIENGYDNLDFMVKKKKQFYYVFSALFIKLFQKKKKIIEWNYQRNRFNCNEFIRHRSNIIIVIH